jgi:hypothetical protein
MAEHVDVDLELCGIKEEQLDVDKELLRRVELEGQRESLRITSYYEVGRRDHKRERSDKQTFQWAIYQKRGHFKNIKNTGKMAKNAKKNGAKICKFGTNHCQSPKRRKKMAPAGQIPFSGHSQQNK